MLQILSVAGSFNHLSRVRELMTHRSLLSALLVGLLSSGLLVGQQDIQIDFESASIGALPLGAPVGGCEGALSVVQDPLNELGQSLEVYAESLLEIDLSGIEASDVAWVDFFTRPAFFNEGALESVVPDSGVASVLFALASSEGRAYAYDGNVLSGQGWIPTGEAVSFLSGVSDQWVRLTYRIDFVTKAWDLFVDSAPALFDLGFIDTSISRISYVKYEGGVAGGSPSFFDYFYTGPENPLGLDSDNDGMPDAFEETHGLNPFSPDRYGDLDKDAASNLEEFLDRTNPALPDTDEDGVPDGYAAGWDAGSFPAAWQIPSNIDFEEEGVLGNLFFVEGSASITGAVDKVLALEANTAVSALVNGGGEPEVWVDFQAVPRFGAGDATTDLFFDLDVDAEGILSALKGDSWGASEVQSDAVETRFTLRLDFSSQSYDVFVAGRRVLVGMAFPSIQPYFWLLQLNGDAFAQVDDIAVSLTEPAGLDNDGDGLTNDHERSLGTDVNLADTDGDGLVDPLEVFYDSDPLVVTSGVAAMSNGVWRAGFPEVSGIKSLDASAGWAINGALGFDDLGRLELGSYESGESFVELLIGIGAAQSVWVQFEGQFMAGSLPDPASIADPQALAFGFSDNQTLAVWEFNLGAWQSFAIPGGANVPQAYSLYLDFDAGRWEIYQGTALVATGLPLADDRLYTLSRLLLLNDASEEEGSAQTVISGMRVLLEEPAGLDRDG